MDDIVACIFCGCTLGLFSAAGEHGLHGCHCLQRGVGGTCQVSWFSGSWYQSRIHWDLQ